MFKSHNTPVDLFTGLYISNQAVYKSIENITDSPDIRFRSYTILQVDPDWNFFPRFLVLKSFNVLQEPEEIILDIWV